MDFDLSVKSIKYIKVVYIDNNGSKHSVKANIKSSDETNMILCARAEQKLTMKTPQEVSLSIICDNGLYLAKSTIHTLRNTPPYVYFVLKTPDNIEYKQNREYFRVKMEVDAILHFQGTTLSCKTYDISANGVRVQLDQNIKLPSEVTIEILFYPKSIKTKANYVRRDSEDNIHKASFVFMNLPESKRDIISQRCIQKQLQDKRNSLL